MEPPRTDSRTLMVGPAGSVADRPSQPMMTCAWVTSRLRVMSLSWSAIGVTIVGRRGRGEAALPASQGDPSRAACTRSHTESWSTLPAAATMRDEGP